MNLLRSISVLGDHVMPPRSRFHGGALLAALALSPAISVAQLTTTSGQPAVDRSTVAPPPSASGSFTGICLNNVDDCALAGTAPVANGPGLYCFDNTAASGLPANGPGQDNPQAFLRGVDNNFLTDRMLNDIWFYYVPATTSTATITTCGLGNTISTKICVFRDVTQESCTTGDIPDAPNGVVSLACNDDEVCDPTGFGSLVSFIAEAGQFYLVQLAAGQISSVGTPPLGEGMLEIREEPLQLVDPCRHDRGSSINGLGLIGGGGLTYIATFDAGCTSTVGGVGVAWYSPMSPPANLPTSATVLLWDDPDDDGAIRDGILLAQKTVNLLNNPATDVLNEIFFDTPVTVSGVYAVGAFVNHADGELPMPVDPIAPSLRSKIYYSEQGDGIGRADIFGSNQQELNGDGTASGIAVDSAGGKVYWTRETAREVLRADLDGQNPELLVSTPLDTPWEIDLDVAAGKMYWATIGGGQGKIYRADLDGSNVEVIVAGLTTTAVGLAVDPTGGKVYWSADSGDIWRADLDGQNAELWQPSLGPAVGLGMDRVNRVLYWAHSTGIGRRALDGPGSAVTLGIGGGDDVAVDPASGNIYLSFGSSGDDVALLDSIGALLAASLWDEPHNVGPVSIALDVELPRSFVSFTSDLEDLSVALAVSDFGFELFFLMEPLGPPEPPSFPDMCNGDGGDQMGCSDCPCMNEALPGTIGGCMNSAGTSTRLLPSGGVSIATADLRFEASGAPPANSAVLTSGNALAPANMVNPCFGLNSGIQSIQLDGLRCVVQGVLRHGVRPSDMNGDIGVTTNGWGTPNGFFNFAAFTSGSTKHFQIIHRDDVAAVCMRGQNTSQSVTVVFEP